MPDIASDSDASIDDLEQILISGELMIGAIRAAQAEALAALDTAQIARVDGVHSLRDWVAARLDVTAETARTLTDAAKLFVDHPDTTEGLSSAEITFDRALATAKLAASGATEAAVRHSAGSDLAGVARLAARHRRITRSREHHEYRDRYLTIQSTLDDTAWRLHGQLPAVDGHIVETALDRRADSFPRMAGTGERSQRRVDALVAMSHDALDGETGSDHRPAAAVAIFVDARIAGATNGQAGAEIAAGHRVGPETLDRIVCDGAVQVIAVDGLRPVAASPTSQVIPPAIRRHVLHRDGGCVIDGCTSRYRLQPHHITPRSKGGSHDPDNLATLCWYHHHVAIHGTGFHIDPDSPPQRRRLLRPDGRGRP